MAVQHCLTNVFRDVDGYLWYVAVPPEMKKFQERFSDEIRKPDNEFNLKL